MQADYSLGLYGALKEVLHHRGLDGNLVEEPAPSLVVEPLGSSMSVVTEFCHGELTAS